MKKILFTFSIFLFFACVSNEDKAKIDGANQFVSGMEKFEKNKETKKLKMLEDINVYVEELEKNYSRA